MLNKNVGNVDLPMIGLGTCDLDERVMEIVIETCVSRGVTFIDSANRYGNEETIGGAIRKIGLSRHAILIGTKMSYKQQVSQTVRESVEESLNKLKTDYIDLYMIHSPKSETYCDDWIALLEEKRKGKIREIAVSNFTERQLQDLYNVSGIYPALNQIEVNLVHIPWNLISFCRSKGIVIQASCPLYRMGFEAENSDAVKSLVDKYHKSYSQIALRWLFQKEILAIPKMSSVKHIEENVNIFDFNLSEEDVYQLEKRGRDLIKNE